MGIKEFLRRIWLISEDKIKTSESVCKQSTQTRAQLITVTDNCSNKGGLITEGIFVLVPSLLKMCEMTIRKKVEVSDFASCFENGTKGKYHF